MMRATFYAAALAVAAFGFASPSYAIPVPCTGDRMVKVVEIPAANQPRDFTVELGYKFPGCFSQGEWIGYINSEKYIKLDDAKIKAILQMAGLEELPPTPSRLQYPWDALGLEIIEGSLLVGLLMYGILGSMLEKRKIAKLLRLNPELRPLAEQIRRDPKLP